MHIKLMKTLIDCLMMRHRKNVPREYTKNEIMEYDKTSYGECIICFDDMTTQLEALPCGHLFHEKCIRAWMKKSYNCPVCSSCMFNIIN